MLRTHYMFLALIVFFLINIDLLVAKECDVNLKPKNEIKCPTIQNYKIKTAVSGFAKPKSGVYSTKSILNRHFGQFGEDAFFIAEYNDTKNCDEKSGSNAVSAFALGVADGVGGWNRHGVDPSKFSAKLMKNCQTLVREGKFVNHQPIGLLDSAFMEMKKAREPVGSSTVVITILNQGDGKLYAANLGDSGFRVFRGGQIVQRSIEQQHSFNFPYQLAIFPKEFNSEPTDTPQLADIYQFSVKHGDVLVLASDGILDNIEDSVMLSEIGRLQKGPEIPDLAEIQTCADSITSIAKKMSQDPNFLSPFAKNAMAQGKYWLGGKEDDTTLVLAVVSKISNNIKDEL